MQNAPLFFLFVIVITIVGMALINLVNKKKTDEDDEPSWYEINKDKMKRK